MKLQNEISEPLWNAISVSYESKNYSNAISDGMKYLSRLIREKSGEDGDGVSLVNATLAGKSPLVKINQFQTETDRSAQEGFYHLLRGLYQGIRNPRAHDQINDSKEDTDAILHFIDYVSNTIKAAEGQFSPREFVGNLLNDDFYPQGNYAKLLAEKIPENKRLVTLFELYRARRLDIWKTGAICREIYKYLDEGELSHFMNAVSKNLNDFAKAINDVHDETEWDMDNAIQIHFQLLTPAVWPKVHKDAKWRVESIIVEIIEDEYGDLDTQGPIGYEGMDLAFESFTASLANEYLEYFEEDTKERVQIAFLEILDSNNHEKVLYLFHFFLPYLPSLVGDNEDRKEDFVRLIAKVVNHNKSGYILSSLPNTLRDLPADWTDPLYELLPFLDQGVAKATNNLEVADGGDQ